MLIYRTLDGLARREGEDLVLLDLPYSDVGALLRDCPPPERSKACEAPGRARIALSDAEFLAPVDDPAHLVIVGANYRDHVAEAAMPLPRSPLFFTLDTATLSGPHDLVELPAEAPDHVDYEAELAVVIGRPGQDISASDAWSHVGGITVANDLTTRDIQLAGMDEGRVVDPSALVRAKSFPGFKPMGAAVVIDQSFESCLGMDLRMCVNGAQRQSAKPRDMIFGIPALVEHISRSVPLEVGDVILTGTPAGVGLATGSYLRAGDVVEVSLGNWQLTRNRVVASATRPQ